MTHHKIDIKLYLFPKFSKLGILPFKSLDLSFMNGPQCKSKSTRILKIYMRKILYHRLKNYSEKLKLEQ